MEVMHCKKIRDPTYIRLLVLSLRDMRTARPHLSTDCHTSFRHSRQGDVPSLPPGLACRCCCMRVRTSPPDPAIVTLVSSAPPLPPPLSLPPPPPPTFRLPLFPFPCIALLFPVLSRGIFISDKLAVIGRPMLNPGTRFRVEWVSPTSPPRGCCCVLAFLVASEVFSPDFVAVVITDEGSQSMRFCARK